MGTVVEVLDTPVVYRTYLPGASSRAIAVGLPGNGRISYAFDATECRLLYFWSGGFLDMEKAWTGHGGWYASCWARGVSGTCHFPLRIGKHMIWMKNPSLNSRVTAWCEGSRVSLSGRWSCSAHRIDYQAKQQQGGNASRIIFPAAMSLSRLFFPAKSILAYQSEDADLAPGILLVHPDKRSRFSISISSSPEAVSHRTFPQ